MKKSLNRIFFTLLGLIFLTGSVFAQNKNLPDQFDLVIFGNNLDASNITTSLKKNPGIENNWQSLDEGALTISDDQVYEALIYRNLSTQTFAGQDIRENYIALKLSGGDDARLRAVYALPSIKNDMKSIDSKIVKAIIHHPEKMQQFSIASQIRPRPVALSVNSEFIEHIEMPVRHIKPGVNEVKWLDIIFSRD